uniref:Uncharacterized protein n=1 Tax=viral metagenome TaxID=1070528 RepID=A0A6H1ZQK9_9ZZZZ
MSKKQKIIIAWAGLTNDKLDSGWLIDKGYKDGLYGIFKTKKEAKEIYQEVSKVEIKILEKEN